MAFPFKEHRTDCMNALRSNIWKLVEGNPNKEEEIVKLSCDIYLKATGIDSNMPEFWKLLSQESSPNIRKVAFFWSRYLCESAFSAIKTKHKNGIADDHLISSLRVEVTSCDLHHN